MLMICQHMRYVMPKLTETLTSQETQTCTGWQEPQVACGPMHETFLNMRVCPELQTYLIWRARVPRTLARSYLVR